MCFVHPSEDKLRPITSLDCRFFDMWHVDLVVHDCGHPLASEAGARLHSCVYRNKRSTDSDRHDPCSSSSYTSVSSSRTQKQPSQARSSPMWSSPFPCVYLCTFALLCFVAHGALLAFLVLQPCHSLCRLVDLAVRISILSPVIERVLTKYLIHCRKMNQARPVVLRERRRCASPSLLALSIARGCPRLSVGLFRQSQTQSTQARCRHGGRRLPGLSDVVHLRRLAQRVYASQEAEPLPNWL
jgi:hypothetical protein